MSLLDERVLILTSTGKDSESTQKLLLGSNLIPHICKDFDDLLANIELGAGVLLLAKEVLVSSNLQNLLSCLSRQESWSDLPILILASAGDLTQGKIETINVLKTLRNPTVLERPVRIATLISILESSIANRKRQYEVRSLVKELQAARNEAELAKIESDRANQAKSEFLANMSHEIRTPLGVILGFSDLALDDKATPEERTSYSTTVQRNGRQLLALVNDILDLAKVEAGRIETEEVETSIVDIVNDIIASLVLTASDKGVKFILVIDPLFPMWVKTDPTRVRQVILNVIGNALKFTKKGSVSVGLSVGKIHDNRTKIIINVTDTGLGISDLQREKLFRPFSQADSSMTREFGGTGLGLVLSRQLTQILGGNLRLVTSEVGVGSTFEITLDVAVVRNRSEFSRVEPQLSVVKDISGANILLVEDSLDNQFIISRILNLAGVNVQTANDGFEAIDKVNNGSFDIILMDVQMPRLDGRDATIRLREQGYQKPIIALTANALKGDKERALQIGFDDYITKPIQKTALFDSIGKFLV